MPVIAEQMYLPGCEPVCEPVVNPSGVWECQQPDCDGVHHYRVRVA